MYSEVLMFLPLGSMTIMYLKVVVGGRYFTPTRWFLSGLAETVKVFCIPLVKIMSVATKLIVEKEIKTSESDSGVISGVVKISDALTLSSWFLFSSFTTEGKMVTEEKTIKRGIITAKTVLIGMPQSL